MSAARVPAAAGPKSAAARRQPKGWQPTRQPLPKPRRWPSCGWVAWQTPGEWTVAPAPARQREPPERRPEPPRSSRAPLPKVAGQPPTARTVLARSAEAVPKARSKGAPRSAPRQTLPVPPRAGLARAPVPPTGGPRSSCAKAFLRGLDAPRTAAGTWGRPRGSPRREARSRSRSSVPTRRAARALPGAPSARTQPR